MDDLTPTAAATAAADSARAGGYTGLSVSPVEDVYSSREHGSAAPWVPIVRSGGWVDPDTLGAGRANDAADSGHPADYDRGRPHDDVSDLDSQGEGKERVRLHIVWCATRFATASIAVVDASACVRCWSGGTGRGERERLGSRSRSKQRSRRRGDGLPLSGVLLDEATFRELTSHKSESTNLVRLVRIAAMGNCCVLPFLCCLIRKARACSSVSGADAGCCHYCRRCRTDLHCAKADRLPPVPKQVLSARTKRKIAEKLAGGLYIAK